MLITREHVKVRQEKLNGMLTSSVVVMAPSSGLKLKFKNKNSQHRQISQIGEIKLIISFIDSRCLKIQDSYILIIN